MPIRMPANSRLHSGTVMVAKGCVRLIGSKDTVTHWRLATAKPIATAAMGSPMTQLKMVLTVMLAFYAGDG